MGVSWNDLTLEEQDALVALSGSGWKLFTAERAYFPNILV